MEQTLAYVLNSFFVILQSSTAYKKSSASQVNDHQRAPQSHSYSNFLRFTAATQLEGEKF